MWIFLLLFLTASPTRADIDYLDLKGTYGLFKPEFQYLSPDKGFSMLGTHVLENLRFFGNYGEEKKPSPECLKKPSGTHDEFVRAHDCPQDSTSQLIQHLFPSVDHETLVENRYEDHPEVRLLTAGTIGKLLNSISKVAPMDLERSKTRLADELTDILFEDISPLNYMQSKKTDLEGSRRGCSQAAVTEINRKITELSGKIGEITARVDKPVAKEMSTGKKKDFKFLADLIVAALINQRSDPRYPEHFVEQMLLALAVKKGDSRTGRGEILSLLRNMPNALLEGEKGKLDDLVFQGLRYDRKTLVDLLKNHAVSEKDKIQSLDPDIGKLVAYQQISREIRRRVPKLVQYNQTKDSDELSFADCGETSLRNFFNYFLYNAETNTFDASRLPATTNARLRDFYRDHADASNAETEKDRNDWGAVVKKHPHEPSEVAYVKPKSAPICEIEPGFDNMMALLDHLLLGGRGAISTAPTKEKKLEELCKVLPDVKHDDSSIKCSASIKSSTPKSTEVEFNDREGIIFDFQDAHFVVRHGPWNEGREMISPFDGMNDEVVAPRINGDPLTKAWLAAGSKGDQDAETEKLATLALDGRTLDGKQAVRRRVLSLKQASLYPMMEKMLLSLDSGSDTSIFPYLYEDLVEAEYPRSNILRLFKGRPDKQIIIIKDLIEKHDLVGLKALVAEHGYDIGSARDNGEIGNALYAAAHAKSLDIFKWVLKEHPQLIECAGVEQKPEWKEKTPEELYYILGDVHPKLHEAVDFHIVDDHDSADLKDSSNDEEE